MKTDAKIFVAGGRKLRGSAILRHLSHENYTNVLPVEAEPDLRDARAVEAFFAAERPEYVFFAAGRSGGIGANTAYPADLMLDNLMAQAHVLDNAQKYGVTRLLYLASSCIYPRHSPQPMPETALMTGPLEPTSAAYATAKLAGLALCRAYRQQHGAPFLAAIPADLFGPGDNFSIEDSHVVGALFRKMHDAKMHETNPVEIWGSGNARREFLYVDDFADACLFVMQHYDGTEPINLGGGTVLSIRDLAHGIKEAVGYRGALAFDSTQPEGTPIKSLDNRQLESLGWRAETALPDALAKTYAWFLAHVAEDKDSVAVPNPLLTETTVITPVRKTPATDRKKRRTA